MKQIFAKKLANRDSQPFSEMASMLYSKSTKLITSVLSILPKWIVFVALIFPITSSTFAQTPPDVLHELPLVIQVEQGLTLKIYSDKYVVEYCAPSYKVVDDTVEFQLLPRLLNENHGHYKDGGIFLDISKDNIFNRIEFDYGEYGVLDSVGMPELPYRQLNLVLPCKMKKATVNLDKLETERVYLDKNYYPSIRASRIWRNFDIYLDPYYQTDGRGFFDNWYSVSDSYQYMGTHGFSFGIFPLRYNPKEKYVDIIKCATFTVNIDMKCFFTSGSIKNYILNYIQQSHYSNEMHFYDSFDGLEWDIDEGDKGNYMILTKSSFVESLQRFINYKQHIGYNVSVYTVGDDGDVSNNAGKIREFIRNKWLDEANRPRFLLIAGSPKEIVYSEGRNEDSDNPPTDLYYACLEKETILDEWHGDGGNLFPELYVGRWNVLSDREVEYITEKTIRTEQNLYYTHFGNRWVSAFSGTGNYKKWFWKDIEKIKETVNYVGIPCVAYDGRNGFNKGTMTGELSGGNDHYPWIFVYDGHGWHNQISSPYDLSYSDIKLNVLNNSGIPRFSFGFGFACLTNNYEYQNNFGRGFTSASMNGGVTYFGATTTSYCSPDRYSSRKIFSWLTNRFNYHIAELTGGAMGAYHAAFYTPARRRQVERYNLIGDPSLRIYGVNIANGNPNNFMSPRSVENHLTDNIVVYPTFAKDEVFIESNNVSVNKVRVVDLAGKVIKSSDLLTSIDVSDIPNGIYFIEVIYNTNQKQTTKIVINH